MIISPVLRRGVCLLVWMSVLGSIALVFASYERTQAGRDVNSVGVLLPPDAAPASEQVVQSFQVDGTYMEWFRTIYKGTYGMRKIAEPLLRVNKDFELLPAAVERWEPSPDGRTWYFYIRRGLEFTDGRPLTAHDYVFTLRRGADPKNAFDFEWYYRPIKNWGAIIARKKPVEALGVRAIDDYTLAIETDTVCPYLPDLLIYSWVSPRQAIEKYGDAWSTRAETSIASGPFYLAEWSKGNRIVLKANSRYHGPAKPFLEALIARLYIQATPPPLLPAYEADEVDFAENVSQAELARIKSDPVLSQELNTFPNFVTYYLTMHTYTGLFASKPVRQAFSHAIDRDALIQSALRGLAIPAVSMLPSGFPAAAPDQLKPLQRYDPALARQRLAEAGYPGGRGFPEVELWVRVDSRPVNDAAEAIQAMLRQNLNIDVSVRNMERRVFMEALNTHHLQLGLVAYGYDYVDASNLLSLWMSNGRHAWRHDVFDRLVVQAGMIVGDPEGRTRLYQQAERLLVEDVGAVFLWHPLVNQMWKSKIKGEALEPNRYGYRAWRGDQVGNTSTATYVAKQPLRTQDAATGFWARWFGNWTRK